MTDLNLGIKKTTESIPGDRREKNWLVIVLGVLSIIFLVFIITGTVLLNRLKKEKKTVLPPVTTPETTQLEKKEIAEKVLTWLGKQKNEQGIYHFIVECPSLGEIEDCSSISDNRSGIRALWAKFIMFEDGKTLLKKSLENDIATYADKEKIPVLQNDFWNCKLTYEIWNSGLFDEATKKKIEEICWRSGYFQPVNLAKKINPKKPGEILGEIQNLDFELAEKGNFVFENPLTEVDKDRSREYSVYPSEFIARYFWHKDLNQLKRAKFYFNQAVQLYYGDKASFYDSCLLGVSSIDLYRATQDEGYLEFAKNLLSTISLDGELPQLTFCSTLANHLFDVTKDQTYKKLRDEIIDVLIREALVVDKDQSMGAFRLMRSIKITLPVDENSLLVGLLIQSLK